MERILTEMQEKLIQYLFGKGCKSGTVLEIMFDVWEPEETMEMIEFCRDNDDKATEKDFAVAAKEISVKKEKRTIDDVWNIKDEQKFLSAMDLYLSIKCDYGDGIDNLNSDEKTFFLVKLFEENIYNSGFTHLLFYPEGDFANDIVPALDKIGAVESAGICKKVFNLFGDKVPPDRDERERIYNLMDESVDQFVRECEHRLHDCDNNLQELCYKFIINNRDSFSK